MESYPLGEEKITFDLSVNLPSRTSGKRLVAIPVETGDVSGGFLFVGHLRGRALPVAAARFLEQVSAAFDA